MDSASVGNLILSLTGVVVSVIGWFIVRTVKQIDVKIDALAQQDTRTLVELAELRVRVTHLEFLVNGKSK